MHCLLVYDDGQVSRTGGSGVILVGVTSATLLVTFDGDASSCRPHID